MGARLQFAIGLSLVLICTQATRAFLDPDNDPDVQTCKLTADGGFSNASSYDRTSNRGASGTVRAKGNQEMAVFQFDLSSLKGQTVSEAELIVVNNRDPLYAADVSTICVPWIEGTQSNSRAAVGEPCWTWRQYPANINDPDPQDYWLPGDPELNAMYPGDFTLATYGNNGSLVSATNPADGSFSSFTVSTPVGNKIAYRLKLDPAVVEALIIGDQYGLTLSDSRGYVNHNPEIYTDDQWGGSAKAKLYIKAAATDTTPPGPVVGFVAQPGNAEGQVVLSCIAPNDSGPMGKAFGYDVRYSTSPITNETFDAATAVDRWRIPRPGTPGTTRKMIVDGLTPGTTYFFAVEAYDQAGNHAAMVQASTQPAAESTKAFADGGFTSPTLASGIPTVQNVLRYWAVSDYDKVNPVTGNQQADGYTSTGNDDYKMGNPVWDAANNKVLLAGARNEVVAFKLILEKLAGSLTNVQVSISDLTGPGTITATPNIELFRTWYVNLGAYYPLACIPLKDDAPFKTTFDIPNADNNIYGQTNQAVWADIYVPKAAVPGTYTGTIEVTADQLSKPLWIGVQLRVRTWRIPDKVNFVVDLNSYGNKWDWSSDETATKPSYFQLAQKHRQVPDTVPYTHSLLDRLSRVQRELQRFDT